MKLKPGMIVPCLWFNGEAEAAAKYYTGIFPNSKIIDVSYYSEEGQEYHGRQAGSVMMVVFDLDGQRFTALNGGPAYQINEAVSFQVPCETQQEIDYYWARLSEGGDEDAQQCGWLKDKFGVTWQIFPAALVEMMTDPDSEKTKRVMKAMGPMKKLDLAELNRACAGE